MKANVSNSGNVTFNNTTWFNFSTDNLDHALYYQKRNGSGSQIFKWSVPKWFDEFMKEQSIPQWKASSNEFYQNGVAPQIADPTKPGHPFTFHKWNEYWRNALIEVIIPGSGEIFD